MTARNTIIVHRRLSRGHTVEILETNRRGHATRLASEAAMRGVDVVVAFGGDGTLNEVATGIAGTDAALGVLPGGSTNVFARTLGMPNDPIKAVELLARGIANVDIRPIGLGRANGRFFCFHAGIGYDAAVVKSVERRGYLKRWLGHPLFVSAAINTWVREYDRNQPHFRLEASGHTPISDGYFSIVLNTNPYTYLGSRPLDLSPAATLDNSLVVVTFRTLNMLPVLLGLGSALRGGGVKPTADLVEWRHVDSVVISNAHPFPYQLDGDYLGETGRLEIEHVPDAVRLVFPGSAS